MYRRKKGTKVLNSAKGGLAKTLSRKKEKLLRKRRVGTKKKKKKKKKKRKPEERLLRINVNWEPDGDIRNPKSEEE